MADIGMPIREIDVVPERVDEPAPAPEPTPVKEPVEAPA